MEGKKRGERSSNFSLQSMEIGRFSSGQELKIICSIKVMRGYRKHEILPRIQVKSSGNQGFRV